MISDKRLFLGLCFALWFVNVFMIGHSGPAGFRSGLAASLISVPVWGFIGTFLSGISLFLFRLLRVDVSTRLSLWQKADVGLALAVVLKPALGIPF
jgi:hypothetical protein